jgi:arginine deiminase
MVSRFHGVDSEVGTLRTVIVHRPGAELTRVLPRDTGRLLFTQLPWAARAQQEHDMFTQVLRDHGVQVLYLTELLQDVLEYSPARRQAIDAALGAVTLGDELTGQVRRHLDGLDPRGTHRSADRGAYRGRVRRPRRRVPAPFWLGLHHRAAAEPGVLPGLRRVDRRPRRGGQSGRA